MTRFQLIVKPSHAPRLKREWFHLYTEHRRRCYKCSTKQRGSCSFFRAVTTAFELLRTED